MKLWVRLHIEWLAQTSSSFVYFDRTSQSQLVLITLCAIHFCFLNSLLVLVSFICCWQQVLSQSVRTAVTLTHFGGNHPNVNINGKKETSRNQLPCDF